jgi:flagellar biosynthesis activator protein FlaF
MYHNSQIAHNAYGAIQKETLTPRSVEYRVFLAVTSQLEAAQQANNPKSVDYITALGDNQLLWNALGSDVASVGNQLPEQLKAQIFYLSEFMTHHTNRVRKGEVDLQAIIDINKMIMEGLSVTPSVQSETSSEASHSVKMQVGV